MMFDSNAAFESSLCLKSFTGRLVYKKLETDCSFGKKPFIIFRLLCGDGRYFKFRGVGEDALFLNNMLHLNHGYEITKVNCVGLSYLIKRNQVQVTRKLAGIPNLSFSLRNLKRVAEWLGTDEVIGDVIGLVEDEPVEKPNQSLQQYIDLKVMSPELGSKKMSVEIFKLNLQDFQPPAILVFTKLKRNEFLKATALRSTPETQIAVNPFWLKEFHEVYHWRWGTAGNKLRLELSSLADAKLLASIWLSIEATMHYVVIKKIATIFIYCNQCMKPLLSVNSECLGGLCRMRNYSCSVEVILFDGHNEINALLSHEVVKKLTGFGPNDMVNTLKLQLKIQKLIFSPLNVLLNFPYNRRWDENALTVLDVKEKA